jgi:hypothetical protein
MKSIMNKSLWVIQGLLALLFIFSGVMKLVLPIEAMTAQMAFPGWFLRFIGIAEVLGGLGLILPGIFKFKPMLTPLAALGLVIIMVGAVVVTIMSMSVVTAIFPFVVGILAGFVGYGRWKLSPLGMKE